MMVRYTLSVPHRIEVPSNLRYLFSGRDVLNYGSYEVRFNKKQISYERDVQSFLRKFPKVRAKLSPIVESYDLG